MHIDLGLTSPHIHAFDVETLSNIATVVVRSVNQPGRNRDRIFTSEPGLYEPFCALRAWVRDVPALWVGFNCLSFDNYVMTAIMDGVDDPRAIKVVANNAIAQRKGRQYGFGNDELTADLFALHRGVFGSLGSLKHVACKLDCPEYMEMPVAHDAVLETVAEMRTLCLYNRIDVDCTERMLLAEQEALRIRVTLSSEWNLDLSRAISMADSSLGEEMLKVAMFGTGKPRWSQQKAWSIPGSAIVAPDPSADAVFRFHDPELSALAERISQWMLNYELVERPEKGGGTKKEVARRSFYHEQFTFAGITLSLKLGGMHSIDPPSIIEADDVWVLWDFDVSSFYPMMILTFGWAPSHLDRAKFLAVLSAVIDQRLDAKQAAKAAEDAGCGDEAVAYGRMAYALKIAANACFGKSSSAFSWLLDPTLTARICVTGELILLQIIEMLSAMPDVNVLSVNTDGILARCRRTDSEAVWQNLQELVACYSMTPTREEYRRVWRRHTNHYLAEPVKGKPKGKGAYGYDRENLEKAPTHRIVVDAVQAYFLHGVAPEVTVAACDKITEFLDYTSASHGMVDGAGNELGHVLRWYRSTAGIALSVRESNGKTRAQPKADRVVVVQDLPNAMPADVDRAAYVEEAKALIADIENPKQPKTKGNHVALEDLSQEQRARFTANAACETPDMARCDAFDLRRFHKKYEDRCKGNRFDTMSHIVFTLWLDGKGSLTRGDLNELVERVVGYDDYWSGANAGKVWSAVNNVAHTISPFAKPQSREEIIEAALTWASEHVDVASRRRKMYHHSILDSKFITGTAINKYLRGHDQYSLCCAICAAHVKWQVVPDRDFIGRVMDEVIALEGNTSDATTQRH